MKIKYFIIGLVGILGLLSTGYTQTNTGIINTYYINGRTITEVCIDGYVVLISDSGSLVQFFGRTESIESVPQTCE